MVAFNKLFTSRLKFLLLAWFIISFVIGIEMIFMNFYKPENGYSGTTILVYFIIQFLVGFLLIVLIIIPLFDYVKNITNKIFKVIFLIMHGIIFGVLYTLSFALIFELYNENTLSNKYYDRVYNLLATDFHNSVRTFLIFMAILFAHDYFKKNIESIIKQKSLENEMDRVRLQSLRAQLQPHFLFNALNNVVALIDENKQKAQKSLIHLSDLLRYTVNLQPSKLVTIEEEIKTLKTYMSIEKAKYENQLEIIWNISNSLDDFMVPPLIIQPLAENAIKHGFKDNENKLTIVVSIKKGCLQVKNNGKALKEPIVKGNGFQLVEKRLQIHFETASFGIEQEGDWVVNTIIIDEAI